MYSRLGRCKKGAPRAASLRRGEADGLLYRGSDKLEIDGERCVPVQSFLSGLRPANPLT